MNNKFLKNLSWIFFGNISHAILAYLLNIILARMVTTNDYGVINYAASLIAFFTAIGTLGFNGIITQKFSENEDNAGIILGTTILPRFLYSMLAVFILQVIVRISAPNNSLLHIVVLCQSLTICFTSLDGIAYWFQYKAQANIVAILRLIGFAISAIWRITVLGVSKSIPAYVFGTSMEIILFMVLLFISYKKNKNPQFKFNFMILKDMLSTSYPFITSAVLVTIYGQIDKVMLNGMLGSSSVAYYSVAFTLAGAISIIPSALIEGFRPDIMRFSISDKQKFERRMEQLYGIIFWLCTAYCLFITIFAKPIIIILYGDKYLPAVPALSTIVWYTSFSYFGSVNGMYMVANKKISWVQILTLVGAIVNIMLNWVLIPIKGIVGAAIASLLTQIITNFVLIALIPSLRNCFKIIINGILGNGFRHNT